MLGERGREGLEGLEGRDFPGIAYWEYLGCGNRLNLLCWIGLDWAGLGWGQRRVEAAPISTQYYGYLGSYGRMDWMDWMDPIRPRWGRGGEPSCRTADAGLRSP